jgi:hypothetical protein
VVQAVKYHHKWSRDLQSGQRCSALCRSAAQAHVPPHSHPVLAVNPGKRARRPTGLPPITVSSLESSRVAFCFFVSAS